MSGFPGCNRLHHEATFFLPTPQIMADFLVPYPNPHSTQIGAGKNLFTFLYPPPNVSKCRYIYLEHVIVQYEQFGMYQMSNGPCFSENHRSELAADKAICSSEIKDIYIPHWEMPKPLVHSG